MIKHILQTYKYYRTILFNLFRYGSPKIFVENRGSKEDKYFEKRRLKVQQRMVEDVERQQKALEEHFADINESLRDD